MKLTIEKVIYGGQGLARIPQEEIPHGGKRVFVPFTLPGEVVEATVREQHRGYCVASAQRIEQASEFRASPPCPWFGQCGGCQLQHSVSSYQVELKREMLAESLTRAGIPDLPQIEVLTADPWGYRNRIRLHMQTGADFVIGYRQAKSHRITSITRCAIAAGLLENCIAALIALGQDGLVPPFGEEVELFANDNDSELLLTLWTHRQSSFDHNSCTKFFTLFQKKIPALTGAIVLPAENEGEKTLRPLLHWGKPSLTYRVAGRPYAVSLGSFFQVNRTLVDRFASAVMGVPGGQTAWDLYAGVGLFSLALTERFQQVTAVESSPSACKDLRKNLQGTHATAVSSTTLEFLRQQAAPRRSLEPDLILVDPPRAGAGTEACKLMARCNPRRIVYVSCDPATLGRDLATLIQSGYRLHRLQLVDMFPQTHHVETIAELTR